MVQRGNLATIIPAVQTGRGGARLTPDEIKRSREVALLLMQSGSDTSPVDHWSQGAARLVDALGGVAANRKADAASAQNSASNTALQQALFGSLGGGSSPTMAPAFSPQTTLGGGSGGMPQMPSASSPAGGARAAAGGPGSSALPASFLASVDRTEGGGGYDTLFGHSQRSGPFAGIDVSQMPISEVLAFADPSGAYGQWVKGQVGRVATPMGRHQIVGSTLRRAANELGLDPSTPFNAETQDYIAAHLARSRVQSASTTGGKIAALRSEWEGFKHVPDAEMAQIVADLEGGGNMPQAPVQVASLDPSIGLSSQGASPQSPAQADAVAEALMNPQVQQPDPVQVAQSTMPQQVYSAPQSAPQPYQPSAPAPINPAILEALSSPYADEQTRAIATELFGQQQRQQQSYAQSVNEWNALQEQRAYDFGLTQEQRGYDRFLTGDQRGYDATLLNAANAREDSRLAVTDARQAGRDQRADFESDRNFGLAEQGLTPTSVREYEYNLENPGFAEFEQNQRRAGAVNVNLPGQPNIGTIPPGYEAVQDPQSGGWSMRPIPGGPAALEAERTANAAGNKQNSTERYGNVVLQDIDRALGIIKNGGWLPVTGAGSSWAASLGGTQANDLRALLDTVKSNSTFDRLQAMRDASPTGAALGAVSDTELGLLQAAIGSLDQSQSETQLKRNLERVRDITDEIVNGFQEGESETLSRSDAVPSGVDPEDWQYMTPEERAAWQ